MNQQLQAHRAGVIERIREACLRAGRSESEITLLAVSKKQTVELMRDYIELCREHGVSAAFGENYVQEFKKKREVLGAGYSVHLIGPLQSNKVRDALELFDVIESVHSTDIAEKINNAAAKIGKTQRVYLQVNISSDAQKKGFAPELLPQIIEQLRILPNLSIDGLMAITRFYDEPEEARPDFKRLRELRDRLAATLGRPLDLSMGMSADFEIAIEQGATVVRVGTALFGERKD